MPMTRDSRHAETKPPDSKTNRIVLYADLRDSTDILINFEQGVYASAGQAITYEKFIRDVHEGVAVAPR